MSDYFICSICEKEFPDSLSKDSSAYAKNKPLNSTTNSNKSLNLCCVGCFFTYVVVIKEDKAINKKLDNKTKNNLKIIKGR